MIAPLNGFAQLNIYEAVDGVFPPKAIMYQSALFEDNEFLNFFDPPTGVDPNVSFYEWTLANDREDSPSNTMYKIMAYQDDSIFYLCRELIRLKLMYFILRRPRSKSSLCTLVYMFIRPELELDPPPASLEQGENSVQTYYASQASVSDPAHYAPAAFVDPNINRIGTLSHQRFPNADNNQPPTQPNYLED
jgi:hypothetical protein